MLWINLKSFLNNLLSKILSFIVGSDEPVFEPVDNGPIWFVIAAGETWVTEALGDANNNRAAVNNPWGNNATQCRVINHVNG